MKKLIIAAFSILHNIHALQRQTSVSIIFTSRQKRTKTCHARSLSVYHLARLLSSFSVTLNRRRARSVSRGNKTYFLWLIPAFRQSCLPCIKRAVNVVYIYFAAVQCCLVRLSENWTPEVHFSKTEWKLNTRSTFLPQKYIFTPEVHF